VGIEQGSHENFGYAHERVVSVGKIGGEERKGMEMNIIVRNDIEQMSESTSDDGIGRAQPTVGAHEDRWGGRAV
jgi:hypothetical protein